jgi:hypothetical protein
MKIALGAAILIGAILMTLGYGEAYVSWFKSL